MQQQLRNIVIVGAGGVTRAVIRELPRDWRLTIVDVDAAALRALPDRPDRLDVVGDATSRLVLARCPLDPSTTLVLASGSDEVNLEVARIAAQDFGVEEIVTVLDAAPLVPSSARVVARDAIAASHVLNSLGMGETRAEALGLGQGELRQVTVLDGSPAAGRALRELHPRGWLVAAVYRDGRLIVPHGDTAVRPKDQVLLVGDPRELGAIAAFFRGGAPTFPAAYGARIGCVGPLAQDAARVLGERLGGREVVDVASALLDSGITAAAALAPALASESIGCLVVAARPISWAARMGFSAPAWAHHLLATRVPVLVVRGALAPKRVVLALGHGHDARLVGGAAIDLARQFEVPLTVLTVLPSALSPEAEAASDVSRDLVAFARLHGMDPTRVTERGNPIERIRHACAPDDLLVLGHSRPRWNTLFTPDVSTFLLHAVPCSALFVPWTRRASGASPSAPE